MMRIGWVLAVIMMAVPVAAQDARVTVQVRAEGEPVAAAEVRSGAVAARTDAGGSAALRLGAGTRAIAVRKIGFAPATLFTLSNDAERQNVQVKLS